MPEASGKLDELLERHPWPEHMLATGQRPVEFLWRFEVDAPLEAMWPLLTDTSRFNRALGLAEMEFEEREGQLHGASVNGGFRQEWIEIPWQWIHARQMRAQRDYSKGFARWVRAIYEVGEIEEGPRGESDGGFELWVYFGWIPRNFLGRAILRLGFPPLEKGYRELLGELASSVRQAQVPPRYHLSRPALSAPAEAQLAATARALADPEGAGLRAELVERLAEHLRSADELELARIQPKLLARRWQAPTREVVELALHATRLGLLDLSWDIVCPHCRGASEEHESLSRLPGESRCEACAIEFDTRSEHSVEVSFRVNPSIRKVEERHWCAAEPAHRAHILVQLELGPGERRRVQPPIAAGLYRLRTRGAQNHALLELRPEGPPETLSWTPALRGEHHLAPPPCLELHNDTQEARAFVLERAQWSDEALRPGDLLSLREFRDIFSEDYLGADVQLAVGMQTLLFTDMVGSTRFYASRGDAEAFVQVRQHFTEIFELVAAHDGVVVKTIGDAVMAAFVDAASAFRAAHAIQGRFPAAREDLDIRVRVSLNRGSCIAVRFNTEIDYFGNAVNLAAKLQGSAGAGQVAFSEAVLEAPGVANLIAELELEYETLRVDLPAIGGAIEVYRWTAEGGEDPSQSMRSTTSERG